MIKQFLVEIDIDKSDHAWISLKVKDFNPDDWR